MLVMVTIHRRVENIMGSVAHSPYRRGGTIGDMIGHIRCGQHAVIAGANHTEYA